MNVIDKQFNAAPNVKEVEGKKLYEFVLSSNAIDRHFERMDVKGIDYSNFKNNPQAFWNHRSTDKPIGKWEDIYVQGDKLYGLLDIHEETDEARTLKNLVDKGYINATSIGFYSKKIEKEPVPDDIKEFARNNWVENIIIHRQSELIEVSLVTIPSNPEAIRIKSVTDFQNNKINKKELDAIEQSIKIGQVLSSKNKQKLEEAKNNIDEVLQSSMNNEEEEKEIDYLKIENKLINNLINEVSNESK